MKVAFFELEPWEKQRILGSGWKDGEVLFFEEPLTEKLLPKLREATVLSPFIYSPVTRQTLEALPNVKLVTTRSTGYDHIDLKAASERGVTVSNVPTYGENTVAEHAFGLLLALSRNIHRAYVRSLNHDFRIEGLKGLDLEDKTLGIVGGGRIGLHMARIAHGFRMRILVHDRRMDMFLEKLIGYKYVDFDQLLTESDVLSLHIPLVPATKHLINRETIAKMKKGAILINTARGGLVDTEALLEALDQEKLRGAGLDVLDHEELLKEEDQRIGADSKQRSSHDQRLLKVTERLMKREDVIFTPHIAFYSQEALQRIVDTTLLNIREWSKGNPINVVRT
ncbi:MAG: hydroxyacid dehydrogenase [Verrucomicrobiae bacterium]|nr:hydroxyacid dehydrogenase [Verrucomicrobiae bacterium]